MILLLISSQEVKTNLFVSRQVYNRLWFVSQNMTNCVSIACAKLERYNRRLVVYWVTAYVFHRSDWGFEILRAPFVAY
jgi:hypothetical protein